MQSKMRNVGCLPPQCMFHLFDSVVRPILTYGSDVWGVTKAGTEAVDKVLLWFSRVVLHVKASTSNIITLGECGLVPTSVACSINAISHFIRISKLPDSSIVKSLFMEEKRLHDLGFVTWFGKVWEFAASYDIHLEKSYEKSMVKDIITRAFKERCFVDKSNLVKNPILRTYDKIKHDFIMEPYLYLVKKPKYRLAISQLRCSSHTLAIRKGRHTKPKTDLSERLCLFCRSNKVEDEKHFIIECCLCSDERDRLLRRVITINPDFAVFDWSNLIYMTQWEYDIFLTSYSSRFTVAVRFQSVNILSLTSRDVSVTGPLFRILYWPCYHRTPLCPIHIFN